VAIPKLAGLCGPWFDQPSASATLEVGRVLWTTALAPLLIWPLRAVPVLSGFTERSR
jgi:hypothetical protein